MNLLRLSCWGHLRSEDVGDRGHDLLRRRHTLDFDITAWRWGGWGVGSRTTIRLGFLPLSRRQPHCTRRCARDLGAQLLCHNRAGGAVTASHETFFKCQSLQLHDTTLLWTAWTLRGLDTWMVGQHRAQPRIQKKLSSHVEQSSSHLLAWPFLSLVRAVRRHSAATASGPPGRPMRDPHHHLPPVREA